MNATIAGLAVSAGVRLFTSEIMLFGIARSLTFNALDMTISSLAMTLFAKDENYTIPQILKGGAGRVIGFAAAHIATALIFGSGGPLWLIAECIVSVAGATLGGAAWFLMGGAGTNSGTPIFV